MSYRHRHAFTVKAGCHDEWIGLLGRVAGTSTSPGASSPTPPIHYVQAEVYRATEVLPPGQFDFVFTGVGALCWLPNIDRWAEVVSDLLAPGGSLFIREGHPMLWAVDEARTDGVWVGYPYFETAEPLVDEDDGTYVVTDARFTKNVTASWNHGIGETVTALMSRMELGSRVSAEHDSVPWEAIPGQMTERENGEWQLTDRPERLAHSYTLQAVKETCRRQAATRCRGSC